MITLWKDEYFTRANGESPVEQWLKGRSKEERAGIKSKMQMLREKGLELAKIRTLREIKSRAKQEKEDKHLYELVYRQFRIGTHFDVKRQTFVYLWAWKKQKNIQPNDIRNCRARLHEYLVEQGERQ